MKVVTDIEQGTPEWLALRLGIITASELDCLLVSPRSRINTLINEATQPLNKLRRIFLLRLHLFWLFRDMAAICSRTLKALNSFDRSAIRLKLAHGLLKLFWRHDYTPSTLFMRSSMIS